MKVLLNKVREAGYEVRDWRTTGARIICITDGRGEAWTRAVFKKNCSLSLVKNGVMFLQERCNHYINNPIKQ